MSRTDTDRTPSLRDLQEVDSADLMEKCRQFDAVQRAHERRFGAGLHRATLTSGLDRRIRVRDAGGERELICFDSNSYLHLHKHPRVIEATKRALDQYGYGTPSAPLLCGTNRHLRELEETLSRFHGREDAVVFSSGYAANVGTISAMVRSRDVVVRDAHCHASIHDGCRTSQGELQRRFPHADGRALERILAKATTSSTDPRGKLVVSDGVFSMHGDMAPLPQLVRAARRHGAYLMLDEAHATGVVGPGGRGTEEHFGLEGEVDILMGTFSKAPGTIGGYVTGSRELISYLRFFARSAMFSAALPAALCAGVTEAFRVMEEEPEHRERLWRNVRSLTQGLRQVGMLVPAAPESAIVPVHIGDEALLWRFGAELLAAGIKAGVVAYPAVPEGEAIVRLTVNARHTQQDIDQTVEVFERLGRRFGIAQERRGEIRAMSGTLIAYRGAA